MKCGKVVEYQQVSAFYNTAENAKSTTRNEKVACSSQVTSSIKTAVFCVKTAVFLTFLGSLKDPQNDLALIWRYSLYRLIRLTHFSLEFCT